MQNITQNHERRTMDDGFQWQPKAIWSYVKVIGVYALTVYCYLSRCVRSARKPGESFALEECAVKQKKIAADLGISLGKVKESIAMLKRHGMIAVQPPAKRGKPGRYILLRFAELGKHFVASRYNESANSAELPTVECTQGDIRRNPEDDRGHVATLEQRPCGDLRPRPCGDPLSTLSGLSTKRLETKTSAPSVAPEGPVRTTAKNAVAGAQHPPQTNHHSLPSQKPQPGEVVVMLSPDQIHDAKQFDIIASERLADGWTVKQLCERWPSAAKLWLRWRDTPEMISKTA
jgi:hypothetical protein